MAVLTVSDAASAGAREDLSGPGVQQRCRELGWQIVATACVPDESKLIADLLIEWIDSHRADLVLTTGGTGVSARDNTPEATRSVLERELPGVGELMRAKGLEHTPFSVLSRGLAGTRKRGVVINLPGSPDGARQSLSVVEPLVPHVLNLLRGKTEHGS